MESFISDLVEDVDTFTRRAVTVELQAVTPDSAQGLFTDATGASRSGVLPVSSYLPGRTWKAGDRFCALQVSSAPRAMLSTNDPELVAHLFAGVCPELRSGQVRIMAVARRPGSRTKVAVAACEPGVDAVGAFVGRMHNRVDEVKQALGGEQVDVIAWHPQTPIYLANALQPAQVSDVVIDEDKGTAVARAPRHQMAAAVGNGGLNSSLAGELVGLQVKIAAA